MNNETTQDTTDEHYLKISDILPPSQKLQMSGRAALNIARNELEYLCELKRQQDDEIKAQHVQIRVLRQEKEAAIEERDEANDRAEALSEELISKNTDFEELELRNEWTNAVNVALAVALIWMAFH